MEPGPAKSEPDGLEPVVPATKADPDPPSADKQRSLPDSPPREPVEPETTSKIVGRWVVIVLLLFACFRENIFVLGYFALLYYLVATYLRLRKDNRQPDWQAFDYDDPESPRIAPTSETATETGPDRRPDGTRSIRLVILLAILLLLSPVYLAAYFFVKCSFK
jgi:hypothetical protein